MKLINKLSISLVIPVFISAAVFANSQLSNPEDYRFKLIKNCQVVGTNTMNDQQREAYIAFTKAENTMDDIEIDMDDFEDKMDGFTDQIEQLQELAIEEDDYILRINKDYLKQQEAVVAKLDKLVAANQPYFDKLEKQGHEVGKLARVFEKSITESTAGIDYDHIEITTPTSQSFNGHCRNRKIIY